MSEAIAFDTHRFIKRLIVTGFTEQQAETLADEHVNLINSNLATKQDVAEIKADVEKFRLEHKAEIGELNVKIEELKVEVGQLNVKIEELKVEVGQLNVKIEEIKADVEKFRLENKAEIGELNVKIEEIKANGEKFRLEFKAGIEAAKTSILKWVVGALIAQGGVIVALIQLLSA